MTDHDPLAQLKAYKNRKDWWSARELIERLLATPHAGVDPVYLDQQAALCTYKDPELRRRSALDNALDRLLGDPRRLLADVTVAETAGLVGAIFKRRWELDGREEHLRDARRWYERGADVAWAKPSGKFDGYEAINAAYVLDILAHVRDDESSPALRDRANALRLLVLGRLDVPTDNWWVTATVLEAHLGLGNRGEYRAMLDHVRDVARATKPADSGDGATDHPVAMVGSWERESTAHQLARLATMLVPPTEPDDLAEVVKAVVPEAHDEAVASFGHRFGLALSGGGFRASLFHLGVLAALSERDLLRPLEVLSCVSGGSIVGTAYYSALATLLESTGDIAIGRDDLVDVVRRCVAVVTETVTTRNLRTEAFFSPVAIVRGWGQGRWSRTRRGGMLYERHLYRPLRPDGVFDSLDGLKIVPDGAGEFRPKVHNWQRAAKVPTLLINATSLGTGRPWRFTASSVGEPVDDGSDTDPIDRLDPIWLDRCKSGHPAHRISVGDAVAASACVPGLFPPLVLRGLYDGRKAVLVDGGVFDNQGISGLLDHDCTEVFISDGSGLMGEKPKPAAALLGVLLRTNAVAMNAIRGTSFAETAATAAGGQLRSAWQIHLLSGLPINRIPPSSDEPVTSATTPPDAAQPTLRTRVYRAISELRTDLDRFTVAEAWALMARGYALTTETLDRTPHPLAKTRVPEDWEFLAIEPLIDDPARAPRLLRELAAGRKVLLKWFPRGRRPLSAAMIKP